VKWFKPKAFKKAVLCYGRPRMNAGSSSDMAAVPCSRPTLYVSEFFLIHGATRQDRLNLTRLTNSRNAPAISFGDDRTAEEWTWTLSAPSGQADAERLVAQLICRCVLHFMASSVVTGCAMFRRCGVYAMPSPTKPSPWRRSRRWLRRGVVLSKIRAFEQVVTEGVNGRLVPVGDVKVWPLELSTLGKIASRWQRR